MNKSRVRLRPVEERDLDLIVRWRNDPGVHRFFFSPFFINPGGQKKWYQDLLADQNRVVSMIETLEGKTVGMLALTSIDWRNQAAEAGNLLIDPDERGKGYVEDAMYIGIKYAFEELNLHRLYGYTFDFNKSIELYEFFHFKKEGVLRQAVFSGGKFRDKILFGLLREEWQAEEGDGENG